jgi:hypothetical protein
MDDLGLVAAQRLAGSYLDALQDLPTASAPLAR